MPKYFGINGQVGEIPDNNVQAFLSKYPDAKPYAAFVVGSDTGYIPIENVNAFVQKYPQAKRIDAEPEMKLISPHQSVPTPGVQTMHGFVPEPTATQQTAEQTKFTEQYKENPVSTRFLNTFFQGYLQSPSGAKLAKSVPPAEGMQHVTELAANAAFDIPAMVVAGKMNPAKAIGYLKKLGDVGNFILSEAGFGATFGVIKGNNPVEEAAIFAGFGLAGKGLGAVAKKVFPIFKKAESISAANKEIMETLPKEEKNAYVEWWESPETQKQLNAIELGINNEANLAKSPQGKELLKQRLEQEQAVRGYMDKEANAGKQYEQLALKKLERPVPEESPVVKKENIAEGKPVKIDNGEAKTQPDIVYETGPKVKNGKVVIEHDKEVLAERFGKEDVKSKKIKSKSKKKVPERQEKTGTVHTEDAAKKVDLPEFTKENTTEDALELGKRLKGNKAGIEALKAKEAEFKAKFDAEKDVQKKVYIAHQKQLYREAREVAEGSMPGTTPGVKEVTARKPARNAKTVNAWIKINGGVKRKDLELYGIDDTNTKMLIGKNAADDLGARAVEEGVIPKPPKDMPLSDWLMENRGKKAYRDETNLTDKEIYTSPEYIEYTYNELGKRGAIGDDITLEKLGEMLKKNKEPERVHTGDLVVGDEFTIAGEKFKVTKQIGDELEIKDGITKRVPDTFENITIDKGSLKKSAQKPKNKDIEFYNEQVEKGRAPSVDKTLTKEERAAAIEKRKAKLEKTGQRDVFGSSPGQGQGDMFKETKSGKDYAKGIIKEVWNGLGDQSVSSNLGGVSKSVYDRVSKFLKENELRLTKEEADALIKTATRLVKTKTMSAAERQSRLEKYLERFDNPVVERIAEKTTRLKKSETEFGGVVFEGEAAQVAELHKEAIAESTKRHKKDIKKIYRALKRGLVDVSGNAKKKLLKDFGSEGKKAVVEHDLVAGAHSKALKDYTSVADVIYKGLSNEDKDLLNGYISSRRTIAIEKYKDIKHSKGLGQTEHGSFIEQLPKDKAKLVKERADVYFKEMDNQLTQLYSEGLITKESYNSLKEKGDYSPRKFLEYIEPGLVENGGRIIRVADGGIKGLKQGSYGLLEMDSSLLLNEVISRTQNRIFRNRANRRLYDIAEKYPDNELIKIAPKKTPYGYERLSVMIDGVKNDMIVKNDFANEWVVRDPLITGTWASAIQITSGSAILKPMATGINPLFAISNFPRDIAHAWLSTTEYSTLPPKALLQIAKDMKGVYKDAILKKGRYLDYINEGGGMEFLTHQGQYKGNIAGKLKAIQSWLGYIGETSEVMTRLALRERALINGKSAKEATWVARNYIDFSQGGNISKAFDLGIPYLNAGIQGTRGVFRAVAQNPGRTSAKVAWLSSTAAGLYLANTTINKEAYDQISDREKVTNWIITTPFFYKDKSGNKRYYYFKIAKDQGQRVFASIAEQLMAKYRGEDINVEQIAASISDAIPYSPKSLPPTLSAYLGYAANKDFWKMEDIWKGEDVLPEEEWNKYTHPAFVEAGKATGLSPVRMQTGAQKYFTYGNIYTDVVGGTYRALFDNMDDDMQEEISKELVTKNSFVRRFMGTTRPDLLDSRKNKEARVESNTARLKINREFDSLVDKFLDKKVDGQKVKEFIAKQDPSDYSRLTKRLIRAKKIKNLPNRRWWLDLAEMNPETRATLFWQKWVASDKTGKSRLFNQMVSVPGFTSKRFAVRLAILKKQYDGGKK